jgi:Ca-activated chloride channel family protein
MKHEPNLEYGSFEDDPRLSAYALDELEAGERAAVEALLAAEPLARAFVDELRVTAAALGAGLGSETAPGLTDEQRAVIEARAAAAARRPAPVLQLRNFVGVGLAAGALFWAGRVLVTPRPMIRTTDAERAARVAQADVPGHAPGDTRTARLEGIGYADGAGNEATVVARTGVEPGLSVDAPAEPQPFQRTFSVEGESASDAMVLVDPGLEASGNVGFNLALVPPAGPEATRFDGLASTGNADSSANHWHDETGAGAARESDAGDPVRYSADYDVELDDVALDVFTRELRDDVDGRYRFSGLYENPFKVPTGADGFSTFSIDVDTASYANVRGYLERNTLPPAAEVRIEELVNYFPYAYAPPSGEHPFAVHVEVGQAPWRPEHRLLRVAIKAREVERAERQPSNLVFLLDVSGSMSPANKLPLLKSSLEMLVGQLDERDHIGIVTYAGTSGVHLASTNAEQKDTLIQSIRSLRSGGSTNGEAGIQLAYRMAEANRVEGVNRVILATDGDFNVGMSSDGALTALIADKAQSGVFLTVLGFGTGNFKDQKLEAISGRGNGTFHYIDSQLEAKKVLVDELVGTLETVAKDVKIQLDFNPLEVAAYRLVGYENRVLANQDFLDDTKDAGEVGAGHQVTALYEIVPAGGSVEPGAAGVEPSRYQQPVPEPARQTVTETASSGELLTVRLRYKQPEGSESTGFEVHVRDAGLRFAELSEDARFASSVAAFGMLLRGSRHAGSADLHAVFDWALNSSQSDPHGYRREFLRLVEKAMALRGGR